MKRYKAEDGGYDLVLQGGAVPGEYVLFEDHQAVRRRLLAKLCEEREKRRDGDFCYYDGCGPELKQKAAWALKSYHFFGRLCFSLERDERDELIAYFRRLGEDK
jgi:hypothetical protein